MVLGHHEEAASVLPDIKEAECGAWAARILVLFRQSELQFPPLTESPFTPAVLNIAQPGHCIHTHTNKNRSSTALCWAKAQPHVLCADVIDTVSKS